MRMCMINVCAVIKLESVAQLVHWSLDGNANVVLWLRDILLLLLHQSVLVDSGVWTATIPVTVKTMSVIMSSAVHHALDIQGGQELTVMKISMNVWTHHTVVITLTVKISMDQPFVTVTAGTTCRTTNVNVSIEVHLLYIIIIVIMPMSSLYCLAGLVCVH